MRIVFDFSKPTVADVTFFSLDGKEPKDQAIRIASGQHSALRAWVVTGLVLISPVIIRACLNFI